MNDSNSTAFSFEAKSDRRAEHKYWFWLAVHGLVALPAFLGFAPAVFALRAMGMPEMAALAASFVTLTLVLTIAPLIAWLQTHHWLGWLFRTIRSRVLVGAERLARDEDELMLDGIREVVFEWRHIDDILRERDRSAVFLGLVTGLVMVFLFFLAPLIVHWMLRVHGLESLNPSWVLGAFVILTLVYSLSGFALSWSVFHSKCFSEEDYDPTTVIQERVLTLLTEVKALRRTGVIA